MKQTIHSISLVMVAVLMAMFSLNANAEINFTSDPAKGSKVYSISTITFTFTDNNRVDAGINPTCTITDKDGTTVCSGGTFAKTATANQIVLTCSSAISTVGDYTITIPAGSLMLDDEMTTEAVTLHLEVLKINIVSTTPETGEYYRTDRYDGLFTVIFDQEVTCRGGSVFYPKKVNEVTTDYRATLVPAVNGCSISLDARSIIKPLIEDGTLKGGESIIFDLTGVTCKNYPDVTYNGTGEVKMTFTLSTDAPVFATSLTLDKSYVCLNGYENDTYTPLTPTITPTTATNKGCTWTSSDTNVATVDACGGVRAVGQGIATITATTTDGTHLSASTKVVANAWLYSTQDTPVSGLTAGTMIDGINTINYVSLGSDKTSLTINQNGAASCESLDLTRPIVDLNGKEYQIKELYTGAFQGCTNLKSIKLPNTITTMWGYVFTGCTNLESVNWPSSVSTIPEETFADCSSLQSITLPEGLTSIGYMAFLRAGLTSVSLPAGLASIGDFGFCDCKSLAGDINIPSSVRSIGGRAFEGTKLTNVNLHSIPSLSDSNGSAFDNYSNYVNVYLTDDSYVQASTTATPTTTSYTRSMSNQWGTLVLPFSITSNDAVQLYQVVACDVSSTGGELTLSPVDQVAANTPCFIKKLNGSATSVCFTQNSGTINVADGDIVSSIASAPGWSMVGSYSKLTGLKGIYYAAQNQLWYAEEPITLPAYRAYLKYTGSGCKSLSLLVLDEEGDVDEIVSINADGDEGPLYNLAGQRVTGSAKGIVISNGKKILRK